MLYLPALVQRVPALLCPRRRLPLSLGLPALGTASPKLKSQLQLWPILYSAPKLNKTKHISLAPTPPYEIAGVTVAMIIDDGAPIELLEFRSIPDHQGS